MKNEVGLMRQQQAPTEEHREEELKREKLPIISGCEHKQQIIEEDKQRCNENETAHQFIGKNQKVLNQKISEIVYVSKNSKKIKKKEKAPHIIVPAKSSMHGSMKSKV